MKNSIITAEPVSFRLATDPRWGRAKATEILQQRQRAKQLQQSQTERESQQLRLADQAGEATRNPYVWATQHTETYNEHWIEEGRPSPYEPFPSWPYIGDLFDVLESERIVWIEKSRDLMISWVCVAYLTLQAMIVPERGVLLQTQKLEKIKQLIKYAKCLYRRQPQWLRDAFPLSKPIESQSDLSLTFRHGGHIIGIPGGADQVRSYHPWGYLLDEASFVADAGEAFNEALAAVKGKIILNSSAGPGWYADARHGVVQNEET